jgi:hypothetical protein
MEKSIPKALSHISSLKHVRDVQLTPSGEGEGARGAAATARNFQPGNEADFACPITGLEMNGKYRFVVLRKSGHVISEKALKQVGAELWHCTLWGVCPINLKGLEAVLDIWERVI